MMVVLLTLSLIDWKKIGSDWSGGLLCLLSRLGRLLCMLLMSKLRLLVVTMKLLVVVTVVGWQL